MAIFIFLLPIVLWLLSRPLLNVILSQQGLPLRPMDLFATQFMTGIAIFSEAWTGSNHLSYFIILYAVLAILWGAICTYSLDRPINGKFFIQWWRLVDILSLAGHLFYGVAYLISV